MVSTTTLIFCIISIFIFLGGYFLGKWRNACEIRRLIKVQKNSCLLGKKINSMDKRKGLAKTYYDSAAALKGMDEYYWDASALIPTPFINYAPAPTKEKNIQINSNQFRSNQDLTHPKPNDVFRVFLVGGSTAFGSGAPNQNSTIGGYLTSYFNTLATDKKKYEIQTVAASAWSSSHERIAIENLVSEMEPDLVITFSGNNEAHWGWNFKNTMWFRSYADNYFWKIFNAAHNAAGFESFRNPITDKTIVLPPESLSRILKKNVSLGCSALSETKSKHYYMFQPNMPLTQKPLTEREKDILAAWHPNQIEYFREYHKLAVLKLKDLESVHKNFNFFDLSDVFDKIPENEEIFLDSTHFGDKGYNIISQKIIALIQTSVFGGKNLSN